MDFSVKGRRLDAAQKRMGEKEKKTLLFQQLLKRKSNKSNITSGIQIISATLMDEWREVANC